MDTSASAHDSKRNTRKAWRIVIIIFGILIVAGGVIWYFVATPFSAKQHEIRSADSEATQLYKDHQKCVATLNEKYKKLTSDNQNAYQKDYDHCETIRKQQNEAVDRYKQLTQK